MNNGSKGQGSLSTRLAAMLLASLLMASTAHISVASPDDSTGGQFGPITPEHTLWSIARENLPDPSVSIQQYMLALVESNPEAFVAGNANLMRSGQMLDLPSRSAALAVSADEARQRLQQQNEWFASLSQAEIRAIRLGETPAENLPAVAAEVIPEALFEHEPELEAGSAAPAETEPVREPFRSESAMEDRVREPNRESEPEPPLEVLEAPEPAWSWASDSERDAAAPSNVQADAGPESPVAAEEPTAAVQPAPARPLPEQPPTDTGGHWLIGPGAALTLLLLVLAAVGIWLKRRRLAETETQSVRQTDTKAKVQAERITGDSDPVVAAAAVAADTGSHDPVEQNEELAETEADEVPPRAEPQDFAEPAEIDIPDLEADLIEPSAPAPEDDSPWAAVEAMVLGQADSEKQKDSADEEIEDDLKSSRQAPLEPDVELDQAFDFGQLDAEPVDELELSSELSPDADSELEQPPEGLDLDFSFSEPGTTQPEPEHEPEAPSKPAPEPAPEASPALEFEAEPELELAGDAADSTEPRANATHSMSDTEAEISLDLASILARTDDSEYARELLEEVIAKGSERMAARARDILATLE